MKKRILAVVLTAAAMLTMGACGQGASAGNPSNASENGKGSADSDVTVVKWFASRPVDGEIDLTMREIAEQYSKEKGGKWRIEVETTADRPSYLQKLKTLIAGGQMPDIIDIDADPYCQELVDAGYLVDVKEFLQDEGLYDRFYKTALRYQEFTDGSMYTLPLEYHVEMIWYNKDIFKENGVEVPKTMDEWLGVCKTLKDNGITPISVDGIDPVAGTALHCNDAVSDDRERIHHQPEGWKGLHGG